ncbi:MAG: hypothetical protein BWY21_00466 [Parcubacteria group bacterium ADurb.Bin216]|nr:MAG: hypothetical protein BWY21_00466 [Parcubacteria group bacterium ADurb.Bin216]
MKYNKGFSLVEMVVVTGIVALLSTILYVNFSNDSKYEADLTKARAFAVSIPLSMPTAFVSEWKFDGPTAAGSPAVAADLKDTWSANDGTPSTTAPTIREGKDCVSGKCLEFNGSNYVNIGDVIEPSSITISLWFYPTTDGATAQALVEKTVGYSIRFNNNRVRSVLNASDGWHYYVTSSKAPYANKWNHVVMTYNHISGVNTLYLNGDNVGSVTVGGALVYNTYALRIGSAYNATLPFTGKLDDINIYKEVMSVGQVKDSYHAGLDNLYNNGVITGEEYQDRRSVYLGEK